MKYYFLLLSITLVLFVFLSCSNSTNINSSNSQHNKYELVDFYLPQWPPSTSKNYKYPELSRWEITIKGKDLSQHFYTIHNKISLEVPKNKPVCILANPITLSKNQNKECGFFKPAGTIYPYFWEPDQNSNNGFQTLTWNCGFSAEIMFRLYQSSIETGVTPEHLEDFLVTFNWKKFQSTIDSKIQTSLNLQSEKMFNPWQIDANQLLENLSYGTFNINYLSAKNLISLNPENFLPETPEILSSFIPENQKIHEQNIITVQKNHQFPLCVNNEYLALITATSAKKVLLEFIYLPIFIEDYEN